MGIGMGTFYSQKLTRLLIVGGGSGIGLAAAEIALEDDVNVTITDMDPHAQERAKGLVKEPFVIVSDATKKNDIREAITQAKDLMGGIDAALIAVGGATLAEVPDVNEEIWAKELEFNLTITWFNAQALLEEMKEAAGGSICLTSSGQAIMAATDRPGYSAAKAGVISLTRSLAAHGAPYGVRVNCIAPGPTDTPRFRAMNGGDEGVEQVRKAMPMGKIPPPAELAEVALFLLSARASAVTGQTVHVNGGLLMP